MRIDDLSRLRKDAQVPESIGSDTPSSQHGSEGGLYNEVFPFPSIPAVDRGASATVFKVSDPPTNENNEAAAIKFLTEHGYPNSPLNRYIASSPAIQEVAQKLPEQDMARVFARAWSAMFDAKKDVEVRSGKDLILQGAELDKFFSEAAQNLRITPDFEVHVDNAFVAEEAISRRWGNSEGPSLLRNAIARYNNAMEIRGMPGIPPDINRITDPSLRAIAIRDFVDANLRHMGTYTTNKVIELSELVKDLSGTTPGPADVRTGSGDPQSPRGHFGLRTVEPQIIAKDDVIERLGNYVRKGGDLMDLTETLERLTDRYFQDPDGLRRRVQPITRRLEMDLPSLESALEAHPDPVLERLGKAARQVSTALER
jgi:hypothetical protein